MNEKSIIAVVCVIGLVISAQLFSNIRLPLYYLSLVSFGYLLGIE